MVMDKIELSRRYLREYPTSPMKDGVFLTLVRSMERCEEVNSWACDLCGSKEQCRRLLDKIANTSASYRLNNGKMQEFANEFKNIQSKIQYKLPLITVLVFDVVFCSAYGILL